MGYCTREDVFDLGLPAEVFSRAPRRVDDVVAATGTLILRPHGLRPDTPILLSVLSSPVLGSPAVAPPGGTSVGVTYYAQPVTGDTFKISTSAGGTPIASFSDTGTGVLGVVIDSGRKLDTAIDAATALIDQYARAHTAPINAAILPLLCAYLAGRIYVSAQVPLNPAYAAALEGPSWLRGMIDKLFAIYIEGAPIQGAVDASPDVAEMGARLVELEGRGFTSEEDARV